LEKSNNVESIDKLLTLGKSNGIFHFSITSKDGTTKEDCQVDLHKGNVPSIPNTYYIYHTFNQDYVEENIRALDYEKQNNIEGFILGKSNIDLKEDEDKLAKIGVDGKEIKERVKHALQEYLSTKIDSIQNITRLNEYRRITLDNVLLDINTKQMQTKPFDVLISDYNKVKSIPENLADIPSINELTIDSVFINNMADDLYKEYSLSNLAENFKVEIKKKQSFIEQGLSLIKEKSDTCPFCGQILNEESLTLIDTYTQYINDTEAQTIKTFQEYKKKLDSLCVFITELEKLNAKRINEFNEYTSKYLSSYSDKRLQSIDTSPLLKEVHSLEDKIDKKIGNIHVSISIGTETISTINKCQTDINNDIRNNNSLINEINKKKNNASEENKSIRKEICKCTYNDFINTYKSDLVSIIKLRDDYKTLNDTINKKRENEKVSKKSQVANTVKKVLNYFFAGKYQLAEDSFHLIFKDSELKNGDVKNVLSDGEKSIIAFAYYLGDIHLKMNREDDYDKLFLVIDDPISSLDFSHVYTLCGILRDLREIIPQIKRERFIILTHNTDFMRIIVANKIVETKMILRNCELNDFNNNLTVPYLSHLLDIYSIAKGEKGPDNTTANSIRHIIETIVKFQNVEESSDSIAAYIKDNIPNQTKSYTLIQDLSHGAWRSEQQPITEEDYKSVCEVLINHINAKYKGQIDYCKKVIS
jgi:wobble nucleotide-excising tRNase